MQERKEGGGQKGSGDECVCADGWWWGGGGVKHTHTQGSGGVNIVRAMKRNKGFQKIDLRVGDLHQRVYALNGHPRCSCSAQ